LSGDLQEDIDAILRLDAVPTILDVLCRTTGMGFAAVARVTETRWIACSTLDRIGFGLKPGDELEVGSTICNEIRAHRDPVVIDHVVEDATYRGHHTPAQTTEATFAKKLAQSLQTMRAANGFDSLVIVADPQTLGQIRGALHKTVEASVIRTISKDLTNHSVAQIRAALN
jgi:protein required for attachment to host cells